MPSEEATTADDTAALAAQGAHVAPEKGGSKKDPTRGKNAPKSKKDAKEAKPKKAGPKDSRWKGPKAKAAKGKSDDRGPRPSSKTGIVLDFLRRPKGATLSELLGATGWPSRILMDSRPSEWLPGYVKCSGKQRPGKSQAFARLG